MGNKISFALFEYHQILRYFFQNVGNKPFWLLLASILFHLISKQTFNKILFKVIQVRNNMKVNK